MERTLPRLRIVRSGSVRSFHIISRNAKVVVVVVAVVVVADVVVVVVAVVAVELLL